MAGSRTPYVFGAIGLAFALFVVMRGDLPRWKNVLLGTRTQTPAPAPETEQEQEPDEE